MHSNRAPSNSTGCSHRETLLIARQDGVGDVSVTPLDVRLLRMLLMTPFLSTADVALTLHVHRATAHTHLVRLDASGLIGHVVPASLGVQSCHLWHLTSAGLHLIAAGDEAYRRALARAFSANLRGLVHLLPRLPALHVLQRSLPPLLATLQQTLRHAQPARSRGTVEWQWVRRYRYPFVSHGHQVHLDVDGIFVAQTHLAQTRVPMAAVQEPALRHAQETMQPRPGDGHAGSPGQNRRAATLQGGYAIWVFLDPGVGDVRVVRRRLSALLRYRESPERWSTYTDFPPVLVLASSAYRADIWRRAMLTAARSLRVDPLNGVVQITTPTATDPWPLAVSGSAARPDRADAAQATQHKRGPDWVDLQTGARSSLSALFAAPLPREAFPPGLLVLPPLPPAGELRAVADTLSSARAPRRSVGALPQRLASLSSRTVSPHGASALAQAELALHLTHRQLSLLDTVAAHPLLTHQDLAILLGRAASQLKRLLLPVRRAGLVEMLMLPAPGLPLTLMPSYSGGHAEIGVTLVTAAGEVRRHLPSYRLTPRGWALLAATYHVPVRALTTAGARTSYASQASHASVPPARSDTGSAGGAERVLSDAVPPLDRPEPAGQVPVSSSRMQSTSTDSTAMERHRRAAGSTLSERSDGSTGTPVTPTIRQADTAGPAMPTHRPDDQLVLHPTHTQAIHRFFVLLGETARSPVDGQPSDERLLWWETGGTCACRWRVDGRSYSLFPDGVGEYAWRTRRVRFWLEYDMGSMSMRAIDQKLRLYAAYAASGVWRQDDPPALPLLLIVVPEYARERAFARVLQRLLGEGTLQWPGPVTIKTTTEERILRSGFRAPIWYPTLQLLAQAQPGTPLLSLPFRAGPYGVSLRGVDSAGHGGDVQMLQPVHLYDGLPPVPPLPGSATPPARMAPGEPSRSTAASSTPCPARAPSLPMPPTPQVPAAGATHLPGISGGSAGTQAAHTGEVR